MCVYYFFYLEKSKCSVCLKNISLKGLHWLWANRLVHYLPFRWSCHLMLDWREKKSMLEIFTTICISIYSKQEIITNILFGVLTVEKPLKLKNTFQTKCLYEVWRTGHAFCCRRGLLWALWPFGALLDFFLLGRRRPVKDYHHLFQAIVTVLQSYRFVCKMYIRLQ